MQKRNKQEENRYALKVSPWQQQEKRPWLNLVVWLVAVIFIFSDIFTDGQCLDKTLSGILKMENKYRVGMGVLLLLNILAGKMEPKQNEVVKMHFIYFIFINIQDRGG